MTLNVTAMLSGETRNVLHVSRFAGSRVLRRESVAEHSFTTSFYALLIARDLQEHGILIDVGRLLAGAILHDIDEAIMVDLPRPIKYADDQLKERWGVMCDKAVAELEQELGVRIAGNWMMAKKMGIEGIILSVADLISVTAYCVEEIKFGNTHMQPVLNASMKYLEEYTAELNKQDYSYKQYLLRVLTETRAFATPYRDMTDELKQFDALFGGARATG